MFGFGGFTAFSVLVLLAIVLGGWGYARFFGSH